MGSSIYTRSGDKGTTSLVNGERISKDSARVEAYGTVDEANSWVGAARTHISDAILDGYLEFFQHRLFNCSSNLATPADPEIEPPTISQSDIDFLEAAIDKFEKSTGPLANFILPGGSKAAGLLHIGRTVCRRAERKVIALAQNEKVDALVRKFVNRGSDFLFATARYANYIEGRADHKWNQHAGIPKI